MKTTVKKPFEAAIALMALAGLVMMFIVITKGKTGSGFVNAAADYFSYFTILSNIMVLALFAGKLFAARGKASEFFGSPLVNGAVTVYISITGLIFFLLLSGVFKSLGLLFDIANILLHYIVPISALLYWAIFMRTHKHKIVYTVYWLAVPLFYLVITLLRGLFTHEYPYPFVDVVKYGYPQVLLNSAGITLAFILIGMALIGLSKIKTKSS